MADHVASVLPELEPEDFYLLSGVEHGMRFSQWVNRNRLDEFARLDPDEVDYRIDRTIEHGLLERQTIQYEGYRLTTDGYDALALHTFAERDTIDGFGTSLGVGKESDVYEVRSYTPMALKFHREGFTNFREVHRERSYTSEKDHTSWLYTARKAAEREYETLEALYPDVRVPRPVDHNRHAVIMERMDGVELNRADLDPDQITGILSLILEEMMAAYAGGYVHADISEYNVFIDDAGITLFDWPQAIPTDHDNARDLLARDVENITAYFARKYPSHTPVLDTDAITTAITTNEFDTVTAYVESPP